jgi:hypothetical protein
VPTSTNYLEDIGVEGRIIFMWILVEMSDVAVNWIKVAQRFRNEHGSLEVHGFCLS